MRYRLVVAFQVLAILAGSELLAQNEVSISQTLASLPMEVSGPEMEHCAPAFLRLVSRGLAIVPELAESLGDATPTGQRVPLFGDEWAVGDVAMAVLSSIIRDIPWLSFGPTSDAARGFFPYWDFVRASPTNRQKLRSEFIAWLSKVRSGLRWQTNTRLCTGGYFVVDEAASPANQPMQQTGDDAPYR